MRVKKMMEFENENELKQRIKKLSEEAKNYFAISDEHNIFASENLQIVKLKSNENSIYYLTLKELGSGAFGSVYHGIQLDIDNGIIISNTDAAIKVTDFSEGGTVSKRNIADARRGAEHENDILKDLDQSKGFSVGQRTKKINILIDEETNLYDERDLTVQEAIVAMPLHPGKDIDAHKDKFSYGSHTFAQLATSLCNNLMLIHNKNIIHSDLKPGNIIWEPKTRHVNIVDFNLAKRIESNATHLHDSTISDKAYMAPECFTDKDMGYRYSKASDVYSLGKILREKFDMTFQNQSKEGIDDKKHLSYDQFMIKSFLNKMTSKNDLERPQTNECSDFFLMIQNKMNLDIEQPENQTRLQLSKKIISLEVYANQLQKEINSQGAFDSLRSSLGLTADKTKKYDAAIDTIKLLTKALSTSEIDTNSINGKLACLYKAESNANGFFSFKGRFQKILKEVENTTENENTQNVDLKM